MSNQLDFEAMNIHKDTDAEKESEGERGVRERGERERETVHIRVVIESYLYLSVLQATPVKVCFMTLA